MSGVISTIVAYLLGSFSLAGLFRYLAKPLNKHGEIDGYADSLKDINETSKIPLLVSILSDICISALVVYLTKIVTNSVFISMLAGIAIMAGHNWSLFSKFKGSLGFAAMIGALAPIVSWQLIFGIIAAGVLLWITRRPGISLAYGILAISGYQYIDNGVWHSAIYPWILFVLVLIKRLQVTRLQSNMLCFKNLGKLGDIA